jgi:citrate lyase subunit beta/citryl-CoA lyase
VPATRADRLEKAPSYGPDALIVDLEDTVPPAEKPGARENARRYLDGGPPIPIWVRPESFGTVYWEDDVRAVAWPGLTGLFLPKVVGVDHVRAFDGLLAVLERERGLPEGSIALITMPESALGVRYLFDILRASPRVIGAGFAGAEGGDMINDLGATWTSEGSELLYARSKVVFDARAAGKDVIVDGVFADLEDAATLTRDTQFAKRLGFTARCAIHPKQVPVINDAFTPGADEIRYYERMLEAFRAAEAEGNAAVRYEGRLVDYAMVKNAERILAQAARLRPESA